jgi:hypothetical protein
MTRHSLENTTSIQHSNREFTNFKLLTENNMLVLSWFTARSSGIIHVCFKTLTLSPVKKEQKYRISKTKCIRAMQTPVILAPAVKTPAPARIF